MANVTFTVIDLNDGKNLRIEGEWVDEWVVNKLNTGLMPIWNEKGDGFQTIPDDLDYRTIRVSNVAIEDAHPAIMDFDAETGIMRFGEWELQNILDEPEYDRKQFQQTSEDFPRKTSIKMLASDYYKPYND